MAVILELRQPLWMRTPLGEALALSLTDYGAESDHLWTCVQQDGPFQGEMWTWHNSEVRMLPNRSMLREGSLSMANSMQTPAKIAGKTARLMMKNKGVAKAKSPKRKAKRPKR